MEGATPNSTPRAATTSSPAGPLVNVAQRLVFTKPRQFYWKSALLAVTTVALIPVLILKDVGLGRLYAGFLLTVHLVGLGIFAYGVRREDIAPTWRGLWIRLAGIGAALLLIVLAVDGLQTDRTSALFWGSLFAIWALHTGALALLHIRGREAATACPFV